MPNKILFLLLFLIAAFVIIVAYSYLSNPLESDDSLIDNCRLKRQDLDQLVVLLEEDREVSVVTGEFFLLDNGRSSRTGDEGFTTERWNAYKLILDRAGLRYVIRDPAGSSGFSFGSGALAYSENDGSYFISKAYFYSMSEPSPIVSSLDDKGFDTYGTYYRKIEENWYLRFEAGISKPE